MKPLFAILLSLVLLFCGLAAAESSPAEMISEFRLKHGERHVTTDATLNRIALEQAKAMAAKDARAMDCVNGSSEKSPASQRVPRRDRQRNERHLSSNILGHGDCGRL